MTSMTATGAPGSRNPNRASTPSPFIGWDERLGMKNYKSQYLHPKWQKRRLEMLESAVFQCQECEDTETTLHVHHKRYFKGRDIWDYSDEELIVLCEKCHKQEHVKKDALANLIGKLNLWQIEDVICVIAGMLETCDWVDADEEIARWRSVNQTAVDAGFIAASLTWDWGHKNTEMLATVIKDNPPDSTLIVDAVRVDRGHKRN